MPPEQLYLLHSKGGTAGGHHILNACPGRAERIHITFYHKHFFMLPDGRSSLLKAVQHGALIIQLALGRIDVFGGILSIGIGKLNVAASQAYIAAVSVGNGKDDATAVAIVIIAALVALNKAQAGSGSMQVIFYQPGGNEAPIIRRPTELPFIGNFRGNTPIGQPFLCRVIIGQLMQLLPV